MNKSTKHESNLSSWQYNSFFFFKIECTTGTGEYHIVDLDCCKDNIYDVLMSKSHKHHSNIHRHSQLTMCTCTCVPLQTWQTSFRKKSQLCRCFAKVLSSIIKEYLAILSDNGDSNQTPEPIHCKPCCTQTYVRIKFLQ